MFYPRSLHLTPYPTLPPSHPLRALGEPILVPKPVSSGDSGPVIWFLQSARNGYYLRSSFAYKKCIWSKCSLFVFLYLSRFCSWLASLHKRLFHTAAYIFSRSEERFVASCPLYCSESYEERENECFQTAQPQPHTSQTCSDFFSAQKHHLHLHNAQSMPRCLFLSSNDPQCVWCLYRWDIVRDKPPVIFSQTAALCGRPGVCTRRAAVAGIPTSRVQN